MCIFAQFTSGIQLDEWRVFVVRDRWSTSATGKAKIHDKSKRHGKRKWSTAKTNNSRESVCKSNTSLAKGPHLQQTLAARLAKAKDTRQKQKLCEPRSSFFSTAFRALPLSFGWVVLWLTMFVDSLEVTDLIIDVVDNCLDREYAHNVYNCTLRSR